MAVFIIGAAGKVGRRLVDRLVQRGVSPLALFRKPEQEALLSAAGAQAVRGDLAALTTSELADLMKGSDTIVFSAGAGGAGVELTQAIDGEGLTKAVDAATIAGVRRFLLVSVFPDALRDDERKPAFETYIHIKKAADVHLVASDLDWVIVRPGTLTDAPGSGTVSADAAVAYGDVSRDNVAEVLATLVERPDVSRTIIELTDGATPIAAAIDRLAG